MAINNPIVAARTIKAEGLAAPDLIAPVCFFIGEGAPTGLIYDLVNGVWRSYPALGPNRIYVQANTDGATASLWISRQRTGVANLYEWVKFTPWSEVVDPRTGRPYDANAEFYNPLAT